MKPTVHRKDIGLTIANDSSYRAQVKHAGGGKMTQYTEVLELEPLLDTDEDKILHLHDHTAFLEVEPLLDTDEDKILHLYDYPVNEEK